MKKGTKFLLLGGFLLTLLGIMIVWAGVVIGGPGNIARMIDNGDFAVNINGSKLYIFGKDYNWKYNGDTDLAITSDEVEQVAEAGSIRNIKASIGGGVIRIEESDKYDSFTLKYKCQGVPCTWEVKDGELIIDNTAGMADKSWRNNGDKIILYVPKGTQLENLEIELGGGEMNLNSIKAEETAISVGAGELVMNGLISLDLNVEIGAGEIKVENSRTDNLSIDMAMGNVEYEGELNKSAEINCSMGNVELDLAGRRDDFNYSIDCSAGNVEIEKSEYAGLGFTKYIDNQAEKEITVECAMGNVEIDF